LHPCLIRPGGSKTKLRVKPLGIGGDQGPVRHGRQFRMGQDCFKQRFAKPLAARSGRDDDIG
jgi:hypothetical protein